LFHNSVLLVSMNYSIPASPQEISALKHRPVNSEMIAVAIAGVVNIARSKGQSLEDLTAEVLQDDSVLDGESRRWLSDIVSQAWRSLP
jgi:hypothetical protein